MSRLNTFEGTIGSKARQANLLRSNLPESLASNGAMCARVHGVAFGGGDRPSYPVLRPAGSGCVCGRLLCRDRWLAVDQGHQR